MVSSAPSLDPTLDALLPVPLDVAERYENARAEIASRVDAALFRRPDLGVLLGDATSASVRELHRYMAAFLGSVFSLGLPELLVGGLPRVLAGYRSRGLAPEYFETLPVLWREAMEEQLGSRSRPLTRVCDWLGEHPDSWLPSDEDHRGAGAETVAVSRLVTILLNGDLPGARSFLKQEMGADAPMEALFADLVQPALYEIGRRWEEGRITAAQEHLASALVARLLASLDAGTAAPDGPVVVVTTAPTETHEFGAIMVADLLRQAGWDVRFLGSQLPVNEIVHFLRMVKPDLIACSVTLEIHLPSLRELTDVLSGDSQLAGVPVLVGGQAFRSGDRTWKTAGADALARDAREVVEAARRLVEQASAA